MSEIEMKIGEYYETHKAKSALLVERQAVRIGLDALAFFFTGLISLTAARGTFAELSIREVERRIGVITECRLGVVRRCQGYQPWLFFYFALLG